MTTCPTDHEAHEGDTAILTNLISEDGALRPIGLTTEPLCQVPSDSKVVYVHRTSTFSHLIIETPANGNSHTYLWVAATADSTPAVLTTVSERITSFASIGDTLCMAAAEGITYAAWDSHGNAYTIVTRDHLLYDLHITQDDQTRVEVETTLTSATARHLDAHSAALTTKPTLVSSMFDGIFSTAGSHATGATMAAAQMEEAIRAEAARRGAGAMHHVVFAIAALRMSDGSHIMHSNIFALMPSVLTTTLHADHSSHLLTAMAYMHRHTITATMRNAIEAQAIGVTGIDIFVSRPQTLLDMSKASSHTTDSEGHTTSLTFSPPDRQTLMLHAANMSFRHAMTIPPDLWGTPLMIPSSADGAEHSLADMHRTAYSARIVTAHNRRLTLGATTTLLHSPFEIGIRYKYPTLSSASRSDASATDIEGELTAGVRADIDDIPEGTECTIVTHATTTDPQTREVWWLSQVQYPLPGMMMFPGTAVTAMEHHLRLTTGGVTKYYTISVPLQPLGEKGLSAAIYSAPPLPHRTTFPSYLPLLFHQTRMLSYDSESHCYDTSYMVWSEESEEQYEYHAAKAQRSWALSHEGARLRTSAEGQPLAFPNASTTTVGDGELTSLHANTRRTADGLFGDGQYYAFTTQGVWVMRLSGGKWNAQQSITRTAVAGASHVAATTDSVAFISRQGVMIVEGSKATLLSHGISGKPICPSSLPHLVEILSAAGTQLQSSYPDWYKTFLPAATIHYEERYHRLWLFSDSTPGLALVYSLRAKTWAAATVGCTVFCHDGELWGVETSGDTATVFRLTSDLRKRQAVLMCSRPFTADSRHKPASIHSLTLRGLLGGRGSRTALALYGSNDLHHWQLIATSQGPWIQPAATPTCRWWRIMAAGHLLPGGSIEGATIIFRSRGR